MCSHLPASQALESTASSCHKLESILTNRLQAGACAGWCFRIICSLPSRKAILGPMAMLPRPQMSRAEGLGQGPGRTWYWHDLHGNPLRKTHCFKPWFWMKDGEGVTTQEAPMIVIADPREEWQRPCKERSNVQRTTSISTYYRVLVI